MNLRPPAKRHSAYMRQEYSEPFERRFLTSSTRLKTVAFPVIGDYDSRQ